MLHNRCSVWGIHISVMCAASLRAALKLSVSATATAIANRHRHRDITGFKTHRSSRSLFDKPP